MVAARIFDALNDPIMGNIIEKTRTKWGKFKPWLLIGGITSSAVVIAAFNNSKINGWGFVVYFGVISHQSSSRCSPLEEWQSEETQSQLMEQWQ